MKTTIKKITATIIILILNNTLHAQTKVANTNGDWFNPAIWTPTGVPFLADSVIINSHVTFDQKLDARPAATKMFRINAGASLKSVGANDSLILGVEDHLINKGEIVAEFIAWGDINVYASNTGTIKATAGIAESDVFYNESGAVIETGAVLATSGDFTNKTNAKIIVGSMLNTSGDFINKTGAKITVGSNLSTSDDFTNDLGGVIVVTNSLLTSDSLINNGDISAISWVNGGEVTGTTGKFCISNLFINSGDISGTLDICDATPNTMFDINAGTIAGSITYCANGPCSQNVSTSIQKLESSSEFFTFYPNPANHVIHVSAKSQSNLKIIVYNTIGQQVKSFETTSENDAIDVSDLVSGIYYIGIGDGLTLLTTQKLIIAK